MRLKGAAALLITIVCMTSIAFYLWSKATTTLLFSDAQMLGVLWNNYKDRYLEDGSYRTIDRQRGDVTTSEGVSYTMLRAVWMADKEVFDGSWAFAENNLRRPDDHLYSWLFGKRQDGSYGVLSEDGGDTSATDADSDIALALIFAYSRWRDPRYMTAAQEILASMWEKSVIEINGTPYFLANDREKFIKKNDLLVNPSYLSPYAYRIFSQADPAHEWGKLVDSSYTVIELSMSSVLDSQASAGLPADWITINRLTGDIAAISSSTLTSNYGYDALRTPWRVALDYQWFHEPRAEKVLRDMSSLGGRYVQDRRLSTVYSHDGKVVQENESPAMYGGSIGYFLIAQPALAAEVYENKLRPLYNPDTNDWREPLSYYDDNWAWFGLALYTNSLPNLALAWCPVLLGEPGSCLQNVATSTPAIINSTPSVPPSVTTPATPTATPAKPAIPKKSAPPAPPKKSATSTPPKSTPATTTSATSTSL